MSAEQSKQRIFDLAAEEQCWVMGQHFPPFPSLGRFVKTEAGWRWASNVWRSGKRRVLWSGNQTLDWRWTLCQKTTKESLACIIA